MTKDGLSMRQEIGLWMKFLSAMAGFIGISVFTFAGEGDLVPLFPLPILLALGVIFLVGDWLMGHVPAKNLSDRPPH